MRSYPPERKQAVLAKMAGPARKSIPEIAKEEGISEPTLYAWRNQARREGRLMPDSDDSPEGWSSLDKFNAVLETAALNEHALAEYCRKKGLYPEQIARWKEACVHANAWDRSENAELARQRREDRLKLQQQEKELRRKDKALAEAAILLVLQKKARAIWGEEDA